MEEYEEINNGDVQEYVMETIIDLVEVAGDLLGVNADAKENCDDDGETYENDGGRFVAISESCINVLSSPICGDVGVKAGRGSSKLIHDCVKSVCSGGMAFMSTCPSNQENFKGVTSVILEALCRPKHIHEEGGDTHGNIYES